MVESRPLYQLSHNHCRWKLFFVYLSIAIWTGWMTTETTSAVGENTFFFFFWDFSIVCVWLLKLKLAQRLGQKWARKIVRLCGREEERERERVSANIEWERERAGLESERVVASVWPYLAKFRLFGKIIEAIGNFWGFIYFLSKLLPTLAKFICHWTKLDCCKWTNMEN